jgi:hypothetical protein
MSDSNKMVLILELISILWVIWAFKLIETNSFSLSIEHSGHGLFSTGVCPLGKFGGWFLCIWIVIFINTRSTLMYKLNWIIIAIIALLALLLNPPLFIRALPFFIIQVLAPYMDKKKYES